MRNAVVEEIFAIADKPVLGIHVRQIGLRVDPARVAAHLGQRRTQQPGGVALAARAAFGAQPPDPERLLAPGVLLHQPQRADHLAVMPFQPEVPGFGEQVAPVQLGIRDRLFDDEHLDPQLEQLVKVWTSRSLAQMRAHGAAPLMLHSTSLPLMTPAQYLGAPRPHFVVQRRLL